jgi:leucyl aminopeptidase (aminopeptidase T)
MTPSKPTLSWSKAIQEGGPLAAVKALADQITEDSTIRYALVGIGAISLLLVAELKRRGLVAIHTGGGTQIMFGIKGRRWDNHSVISKFYNHTWTRPSLDEIPTEAMKIEGACYW